MTESEYHFGPFVLYPARHELFRDGEPVEIRGRTLSLLLYFVSNPGQIHDKNQLLDAVWGGRMVEQNNLTVQMSALRRLLGNDADGIPYIRTLPGQGYIFGAAVRQSGEAPAAAAEQPPVSSGLPHFHTSFIGRQADLADLTGRLRTHRLIVMTGIGGVGKTRLATQAASDLAGEYDGGVAFVDLAPMPDPARVPHTVAAAVQAGGGFATTELAIVSALGMRRMLIILDNAEHLTPAVGSLARLILAECPNITLLVTSRESLGVAGERIFRLTPMPVPPENPAITAAEALRYDAVRLFVSRASALLRNFELTDANAPAISESCRQLDGISLAIEMLVPRLQVLTAQQIVERLHERFRLLASGARDALPRQRTLRTMFDWSWELLQPPERELLERLAVFTGGALLHAVVAMSPSDMDEWTTLDRLTTLVEKSLVSANIDGNEPRYLLLQTTRQYVLERLTPAVAEALRRRHLMVVIETFERAEAEWPTASSTVWLARYAADTENLRSALRWAFGEGNEVELGLRLVSISYPLSWELASFPLPESRYWFDMAVARIGPATPASVQARLWLGHSWRDVQIGDTVNRPSADKAVRLFRSLNDPIGLGASLWRAGCSVLLYESLAEAETLLKEAECVLRARPPTKWLALTLIRRGDVLAQREEFDAALVLFDEALVIAQQTSYSFAVMLSGNCRAELLFRTGRREDALAQLTTLRHELPRGVRTQLVSTLATHLASADRDEEALHAIRETIADTPVTGMLAPMARGLETLALLVAEAGKVREAAIMLGFVLTIHPASRHRTGGRREVYIRLNAALASATPPLDLPELMAEGAAWSADDALRAANLHLAEFSRAAAAANADSSARGNRV